MILYCYYHAVSRDHNREPDDSEVRAFIQDNILDHLQLAPGEKEAYIKETLVTTSCNLSLFVSNYVPPHGFGELHREYPKMFTVDTDHI